MINEKSIEIAIDSNYVNIPSREIFFMLSIYLRVHRKPVRENERQRKQNSSVSNQSKNEYNTIRNGDLKRRYSNNEGHFRSLLEMRIAFHPT